jgi:hypothetical protein
MHGWYAACHGIFPVPQCSFNRPTTVLPNCSLALKEFARSFHSKLVSSLPEVSLLCCKEYLCTEHKFNKYHRATNILTNYTAVCMEVLARASFACADGSNTVQINRRHLSTPTTASTTLNPNHSHNVLSLRQQVAPDRATQQHTPPACAHCHNLSTQFVHTTKQAAAPHSASIRSSG